MLQQQQQPQARPPMRGKIAIGPDGRPSVKLPPGTIPDSNAEALKAAEFQHRREIDTRKIALEESKHAQELQAKQQTQATLQDGIARAVQSLDAIFQSLAQGVAELRASLQQDIARSEETLLRLDQAAGRAEDASARMDAQAQALVAAAKAPKKVSMTTPRGTFTADVVPEA
jgi:hypothetical protein